MENLFVPFELALKLKEKGFNEPCPFLYGKKSKMIVYEPSNPTGEFYFYNNSQILAPLWQQVIDWIREEKKIYLSIRQYPMVWDYTGKISMSFDFNIYNLKNNTSTGYSKEYKFYYSALQSGIEKALDLI